MVNILVTRSKFVQILVFQVKIFDFWFFVTIFHFLGKILSKILVFLSKFVYIFDNKVEIRQNFGYSSKNVWFF